MRKLLLGLFLSMSLICGSLALVGIAHPQNTCELVAVKCGCCVKCANCSTDCQCGGKCAACKAKPNGCQCGK